MPSMLLNWYTSLPGLVVLIIGAVILLIGVFRKEGVSIATGAAICTAGLGLLAAKDQRVTGGTIPQTHEAEARTTAKAAAAPRK